MTKGDIAPIIPKDSGMIRCKKKHHITKYSMIHDATFCNTCDRWLEKRCTQIKGNPCGLCENRPRKPSMGAKA